MVSVRPLNELGPTDVLEGRDAEVSKVVDVLATVYVEESPVTLVKG